MYNILFYITYLYIFYFKEYKFNVILALSVHFVALKTCICVKFGFLIQTCNTSG